MHFNCVRCNSAFHLFRVHAFSQEYHNGIMNYRNYIYTSLRNATTLKTSCRNCLLKSVPYKSNICTKQAQQRFYYKAPNQKSKVDTLVIYSIYGSMLLGTCLLSYIAYDILKRRNLRKKGIVRLDKKEAGRMPLIEYKNWVLPDMVVNEIKEIETFETTEDDVWVISYPRSGTTWLQEIVYLIHSNMDMTTAMNKHLDERWWYLEFVYPGIQMVKAAAPPRLIKSHLPYSLLPDSVHEKKPKIIYIARNPKDVVVSYFYFCRLLSPVSRYSGEFRDFFDQFIKDKAPYSPWSKHVLEYWDKRFENNILYITYEELKGDTYGTIEKISQFLGKPVSSEQKKQIVEHCSFGSMKANPKTNYSWFKQWGIVDPKEGEVLRKGCIGDWMNHLSPEMEKKIADMMNNSFKNSDISFTFKGSQFTVEDK